MNRLVLAASALLLLSAAPALAMSCCGGKGKAAMCGKGGMAKGGMVKGELAMSHGATKRGKKGCCCDGMAGGMSRRG